SRSHSFETASLLLTFRIWTEDTRCPGQRHLGRGDPIEGHKSGPAGISAVVVCAAPLHRATLACSIEHTTHTHAPNPLGATNQRPLPLSATGEQTVITIGGCSSSDKGSGPAGTKIPARTSTVTPCQVAPDPGKFDTALSLPQDKEGELRATVEPPQQSASVGDDPLVQHHPLAATAAVRAAKAQALNVDSSPEQIKLSTASSEDPRSATPVPKEEVKASSQQPDGDMEKSGDGDKKASEKSSDQGSSANLVGVQLGVPDDTEVIDWAAAVDQCSGDVSFLEELLVDLWNESNAHMEQLREFIPRGAMRDTQHEAHSIKGAAANLMCHRLRLSALYLERAGQVGTRLQEAGSSDFNSVKEDLKKGQQVLERELSLFQDLLKQKKLV
ncbi:unnamed protein product, partial [Ectocarpus sp. 12 AP-2014]